MGETNVVNIVRVSFYIPVFIPIFMPQKKTHKTWFDVCVCVCCERWVILSGAKLKLCRNEIAVNVDNNRQGTYSSLNFDVERKNMCDTHCSPRTTCWFLHFWSFYTLVYNGKRNNGLLFRGFRELFDGASLWSEKFALLLSFIHCNVPFKIQ